MSVSVPCIVFPDDYQGYHPDFFCVPKHYEDALECVLIPGGLVKDRVERLARNIAEDIGDDTVYALCVLKGGYKFFTDLIEQVNVYNHFVKENTVQISVDFIRLKSYEDDQSSGHVQVSGIDDLGVFKGKNVLVVEDVIDTGQTIKLLLELLKEHEAKCVKVASLLVKRTPKNVYRPDFCIGHSHLTRNHLLCGEEAAVSCVTTYNCGFEVPDKFVVGYAIDYNEFFRDLDHVCVVNEYGKIKFGSSYKKKQNST